MKKIFILSLMLFGTLSQWAYAQTDRFKVDSLTVKRIFQPTLAEANKVNFKPELPSIEPEKPKLNYTSLNKKDPIFNRIQSLSPLKPNFDWPFQSAGNYVRIGFGNYNTPHLRLALNTKDNRKSSLGLDVYHLSSASDLEVEGKSYSNASFQDTRIRIFGKTQVGNQTLESDLAYNRNGIHYYGKDSLPISSHPSLISLDENIYNTFRFSADLRSPDSTKSGFSHRTQTGFRYISDKLSQAETQVLVGSKMNYRFGLHHVGAEIKYDLTQYQTGQVEYRRNMFHLNPSYFLKGENWRAELGFRSVLVSDTAESNFNLFPNLVITYQIPSLSLQLFANLQGDVYRNSYQQMVERNPFVGQAISIRNSSGYEFATGIKWSPDKSTDMSLGLSIRQSNNELFYLPNGDYSLKPVFDRSCRIFNPRFAIKKSFNSQWDAELNLDYKFYVLDTLKKPWLQPLLSTKLGVNWHPDAAWTFSLTGFLYSGTPTLNNLGTEVELNGILDMNFQIQYRYTKGVSFFLMGNNLLSSRYFRWFAYPTYGIQVLGGINLSF